MSKPTIHIPVLATEVLDSLNLESGKIIVDGTLGGGGHTRLIAEIVGPDGFVVGFDRDEEAVERTSKTLAGRAVKTVHANFSDIPEILKEAGIKTVDGILLDLGLSSDQLEDRDRGFSFKSEGLLDLRFDTTVGDPAWKMLNRMTADHLATIIYKYGEERNSRRIARRIVARALIEPIKTAADLAEVIRKSVPKSSEKIHPATRTFQALRIAVNDELKWVEVALKRLPACLSPGGRFSVISFHSLEDRLVKEAFRDDARLQMLTKKPIRPTEEEIISNIRSRSAKLRIAERIGN